MMPQANYPVLLWKPELKKGSKHIDGPETEDRRRLPLPIASADVAPNCKYCSSKHFRTMLCSTAAKHTGFSHPKGNRITPRNHDICLAPSTLHLRLTCSEESFVDCLLYSTAADLLCT